MGVIPVRWWKNLLKLVALEKPSRDATLAAGSSELASMRLASKTTRRSMNSFAGIPAAASVARESVRGE
ncbi:hypothetical protein GCM10027447_10140 [Glycomyces halotolerans]